MRSSVKHYIIAVVCIFFVTACAVRTPVQKVSVADIKANLKYENVIFRNFTANPGVKAPEGQMMECRQSAINYLQMKRIYNEIARDSGNLYTGPTMYVDVNVTSLRIVGGAARFWAGALAGRSNMNIDVKLIDADGTVIAQKELIGAPNALSSAWSFGGADRSLAQKMGFLLGDFILANSIGK